MSIVKNFNLANEFNILSIVGSAFFVPHMLGRQFERECTVGLFTKTGFASSSGARAASSSRCTQKDGA